MLELSGDGTDAAQICRIESEDAGQEEDDPRAYRATGEIVPPRDEALTGPGEG
jgi:hypothetical protein